MGCKFKDPQGYCELSNNCSSKCDEIRNHCNQEEEEMNRVGTIVMLKRECLGNPQGSIGVVFYDYGDGFQAIFSNGNYDGFSTDDKEEVFGGKTEADFLLERTGFEPKLADYKFRNVCQVSQDFGDGLFDSVLKRGNV